MIVMLKKLKQDDVQHNGQALSNSNKYIDFEGCDDHAATWLLNWGGGGRGGIRI